MPRDLTKVIKHVDQLVLGAIKSDYTPDVVTLDMFPFLDLGALHDESVSIKTPKAATRLLDGSTYQKGTDFEIRADGMELSADLITVLEKLEKQDLNVFQLYGPEPQFVMPVSFNMEFQGEMSAKGKRLIGAIGNKTLTTLASSGAGNPGYGFGNFDQAVDADSEIRRYATLSKGIYRPGLQLWCDPRFGNFGQTVNLFDASLKRRKGTFSSDHATIWQTGIPERFLRFDGVNDQCGFGSICNIGAGDDAIVEMWIRIQGADGIQFPIAAKKSNGAAANAGWYLRRSSTNTIEFILGDASAYLQRSSTELITINVWKHIAVVLDRDQFIKFFFNSLEVGSGSVIAINDSSNSLPMVLGADSTPTVFGQIDVGAFRFYNFGPGGLPSSFPAILATHFNIEKSAYGL